MNNDNFKFETTTTGILAGRCLTRDTWTLRRPALSCTKAWRQKRSRQRPELAQLAPPAAVPVPQDFPPNFLLSAKDDAACRSCVTNVVGDMLVLYFREYYELYIKSFCI